MKAPRDLKQQEVLLNHGRIKNVIIKDLQTGPLPQRKNNPITTLQFNDTMLCLLSVKPGAGSDLWPSVSKKINK